MSEVGHNKAFKGLPVTVGSFHTSAHSILTLTSLRFSFYFEVAVASIKLASLGKVMVNIVNNKTRYLTLSLGVYFKRDQPEEIKEEQGPGM